jgi:hypothetical protein
MLTEKDISYKIGLGYWGYFAQAKEIFLQYSNQKFYQIILLVLLCIIILVSGAHAGWSEPVRISEPGSGYYPKIIAQGETLHVVYVNNFGHSRACYLRSSDNGQTWNQHMVLTDTINTSSPWYPQIIRNGNMLMALWQIYIMQGFYHDNIGFSVSDDNGLNWSTPRYILTTNFAEGILFGASAIDSVVNIIASCTIRSDSIFYSQIRSTNFGQSWSAPNIIFYKAQSGIPDQVSEGATIHFVWDGRYNLTEKWEIHYIKSTNSGLNWLPSITLSDSDQFHSLLPAIEADSSKITCAWMDYKYSPYMGTGDIMLRQSNDTGYIWSAEKQLTFNHLASGSDVVSSGDTIIVAWEDARMENGRGSIYCTKSTDNGIVWNEPYWVDNDTNYSINPAIATSNRRIFVIWEEGRPSPDTSGLFFSRYDPEPDAIEEANHNIPEEISLSAYPNPFNPSIKITYSSKKGGEINIYNTSGQLLNSFFVETGGTGMLIWNAKDSKGKKITSGIYFVKFSTGVYSKTIKLIYLK